MLDELATSSQVAGVADCSYKYSERRNSDSQYMSLFKIDCPSQPDRVFEFNITQDDWEWEGLTYMYHDTCSENCSQTQLINSAEHGEGRTKFTFRLSHASGQTKGGFVGPANGYGYRSFNVDSSI